MGLLGDVYSYGDGLKRKLRGLLDDPMGALELGATRFGEDQRGLLNLQSNAYPFPGEKTVLNTPKQIAGFRKELADKGAEQAMAAATVWHGSPHKFDKFDSSKIGTGEGAQAYGHGLYLAEAPEVAKGYQSTLAGHDIYHGDRKVWGYSSGGNLNDPYLGRDGSLAAKALQRFGSEKSAVESLANGKTFADQPEVVRNAAIKAINDKNVRLEAHGSLYKVDLPDEHISRMLDWDKPLSQQQIQSSPFAAAQKSALESLPSSFGPRDIPLDVARDIASSKTGAQLYDLLKSQHGPDKAAQIMRDAGIPGIRYLDGGSRGAVGGTSNYVVFPGNEGLLSILERNGAPMK